MIISQLWQNQILNNPNNYKIMENLAKAIIAVMKEVEGIEKSMTVGSGGYSYKGVSDYEVKQAYKKAMVKHGLCILPIGVKDNLKESNWMEGNKFKRNVFCSVETKYLLLHTSGESQILTGYGHGIDTGDKAAGKATTYALKYALLYTFMTPTGKILDSDNDHSEELAAPKPNPEKSKVVNGKPTVNDSLVPAIIKKAIREDKTIKDIEKGLHLTDKQREEIKKGLVSAFEERSKEAEIFENNQLEKEFSHGQE
jgi:hypothetical protein